MVTQACCCYVFIRTLPLLFIHSFIHYNMLQSHAKYCRTTITRSPHTHNYSSTDQVPGRAGKAEILLVFVLKNDKIFLIWLRHIVVALLQQIK